MSYSEKVLDHYENPRNVGTLDKNDPTVGTGMVGAPACGDVMKLQIKIEDGIIIDAKFKTYGCVASNTRILTDKKMTDICNLAIGDKVVAWNGISFIHNEIIDIIEKWVPISDCIKITFNGDSRTNKFIVHKEHIFWGAKGIPIEAQNLKIGDECFEILEKDIRNINNVGKRPEIRKLSSERMSGGQPHIDHSKLPQNTKGYKHSEEFKKKISIASKKNWESPEYIQNWAEGMKNIDLNARPTLLEKKFIEEFKDIEDIEYVGDWNFVVNNRYNPDFKIKNQNKVIEVYDPRWNYKGQNRSKEDWKVTREKQLEGYKVLFIPINEIHLAKEKVMNFIHNGIEVLNIETNLKDKRKLRGIEYTDTHIKVYDLKLKEGANIYFTGRVASHNCGSAIASSSLLTEWVKGKTIEEAYKIKNVDIAHELALPPVKIHCSVLAEDAIKAAIGDYNDKCNGSCSS